MEAAQAIASYLLTSFLDLAESSGLSGLNPFRVNFLRS